MDWRVLISRHFRYGFKGKPKDNQSVMLVKVPVGLPIFFNYHILSLHI